MANHSSFFNYTFSLRMAPNYCKRFSCIFENIMTIQSLVGIIMISFFYVCHCLNDFYIVKSRHIALISVSLQLRYPFIKELFIWFIVSFSAAVSQTIIQCVWTSYSFCISFLHAHLAISRRMWRILNKRIEISFE